MRHDLETMGRVILWLVFVVGVTPVVAVVLRAMARAVYQVDFE